MLLILPWIQSLHQTRGDSHAALPGMLERRSGTILNISSVAAFMPRSTYGAVKSWQVMFSRWASSRYRSRGVTVTAVCPRYTHTEFHERLGLAPGEEGITGWQWLKAPRVVEESLRDTARGKAVSAPSKRYKAITTVTKLAPTGLMAKLARGGAEGFPSAPHPRTPAARITSGSIRRTASPVMPWLATWSLCRASRRSAKLRAQRPLERSCSGSAS